VVVQGLRGRRSAALDEPTFDQFGSHRGGQALQEPGKIRVRLGVDGREGSQRLNPPGQFLGGGLAGERGDPTHAVVLAPFEGPAAGLAFDALAIPVGASKDSHGWPLHLDDVASSGAGLFEHIWSKRGEL